MINGFLKWCRWGIDSGVCNDGEEFVNTRPWDGPRRLTFGKLEYTAIGGLMKRVEQGENFQRNMPKILESYLVFWTFGDRSGKLCCMRRG